MGRWCLIAALAAVRAGAVELLPVDEVLPGMTGIGLSVFQGTRVDTFAVEVLGVKRNAQLPGRDLILARLSGAGLEDTGLVQGMSGSPVYLGGRLVGAVAWGWPFAKEPICGITPIQEMLAVMDRDLSGASEDGASKDDAPSSGQPRAPLDGATEGLQPLATAVWVSGAGPAALRLLADVLAPVGLEPMAVPSGADAAVGDAAGHALGAGDAVGVRLVGGDLSVAYLGTVTHVDGQRLVAFGHALAPVGAIDLPLTGVRIFGVLANDYASFKLGAVTAPVGAARQDRISAVAGVLGARAEVLPLEVEVASPHQRTFSFELARHRLMTAGLAQVALLGAVESAAHVVGEGTLDLALEADLVDGRRATWRQVYSGLSAPFTAADEVGQPLRWLLAGPFADVQVERVALRAGLRDRAAAARVVSARLSRDQAAPGDRVDLVVRLAPYRAAECSVTVTLSLPADAVGELQVRLGPGSAALAWEDERLGAAPPADSGDLLRLLGRPRRDDRLVVELVAAQSGVAVAGRELPAPPPSVQRLLAEAHASGPNHPLGERVLARVEVPVDYVLSGQLALALSVQPGERR